VHNLQRLYPAPSVCRYSVAIMVDTEGSEVHTNELKEPIKAEVQPATGLFVVVWAAMACHDSREAGFAGC
jgi:hypothetical protein